MNDISFKITEFTTSNEVEKYIDGEGKKVVDFLDKELKKLRTNKTSSALVDDIRVNVYGGQIMALKNLAMVTAPDATTLIIQPFDHSTITDIERALSAVDLGAQPRNEGNHIKISLPPMSKERRNELVKIVAKKQEEALIAIRKVRQDIMTMFKQAEKDKKISEDTHMRFSKTAQQWIDENVRLINDCAEKKNKNLVEM